MVKISSVSKKSTDGSCLSELTRLLESCQVQQMIKVSKEHFRGETIEENKRNDLHQCLW